MINFMSRTILGERSMLHKIVTALWGKFHADEFKKFLFLSLGRFCIIGAFVPVKTLKDSIFVTMVGTDYVPRVKFLSLAMFFILILLYSKLISYLSREKVIYLLVSLFAGIGLIFAYFLAHPTIGLANDVPDPSRILGWLFFIFGEGYNAIIVALWWAFTNDITTPESAKRGYGWIVFFSQAGGLLMILLSGHYVLSSEASRYAVIAPRIVVFCMMLLLMLAVVLFFLERIVPKKELAGYQAKGVTEKTEQRVGFFEGLWVLFTRPYVGGIFGLIFFHEALTTVMYFHLMVIAKQTYVVPGLVNQFFFRFQGVNQIVACFFALFGTSFLQRVFGIRFCLVSYPLLLGACIFSYVIHPTLFAIAAVLIVGKAIHYALNIPAREVLYIPTSRNIKYKSKAWIDMFGTRFAKATGSGINEIIGAAVGLSGMLSFVFISFWVVLANGLGKTFSRLTKHKKQID